MNLFKRKPKTDLSTKYQEGENFDIVAAKLIDSLRPMFAAHPDTDEVRLNVIREEIIRDGEIEDGLDSIVENLNDMNYKEVVAPISQEQARQLKVLLNRAFVDKPTQLQNYLAVVDRITKPALINE